MQKNEKKYGKGNVYDDMMKLFVRVFAFDKVNKMAGIVMLYAHYAHIMMLILNGIAVQGI